MSSFVRLFFPADGEKKKTENNIPAEKKTPPAESNVFAGMPAPGEVYAPEKYNWSPVDVPVIELTEKEAVDAGWSYKKKSKSIRITNYHGRESHIVIPSMIGGKKVSEIGEKAFYRSGVSVIEIPDTVRKLGEQTFYESKAERVIFGENVETIPDMAFSGCVDLKDVHLPLKLRSIGTGAFYSCKSLSYIKLPPYIFDIGNKAFFASGLTGFSNKSIYSLTDGLVFGETPMHKKYKLVLKNKQSGYPSQGLYQVLLVGEGANIKFPPGCNVTLADNAVQGDCCLDFSECGNVSFRNAYYDRRDVLTGERTAVLECKAVIHPKHDKELYLPDYVCAVHPDGTSYPGLLHFHQVVFGKEVRRTIWLNDQRIPPNSICTGADVLTFEYFRKYGVFLGRHCFAEKNLKRLYLNFTLLPPLKPDSPFMPCCVQFHEMSWKEGEETVKKCIPPSELVTEKVHTRLLAAFKWVDKDIPRVRGEVRHGHEKYFFDSTVIDRVFKSGGRSVPVKARDRVLIAIDVLRSTQRECDSDTDMYLQYLKDRKRFAEKVCRGVRQKYPEYGEFLKGLDAIWR